MDNRKGGFMDRWDLSQESWKLVTRVYNYLIKVGSTLDMKLEDYALEPHFIIGKTRPKVIKLTRHSEKLTTRCKEQVYWLPLEYFFYCIVRDAVVVFDHLGLHLLCLGNPPPGMTKHLPLLKAEKARYFCKLPCSLGMDAWNQQSIRCSQCRLQNRNKKSKGLQTWIW